MRQLEDSLNLGYTALSITLHVIEIALSLQYRNHQFML